MAGVAFLFILEAASTIFDAVQLGLDLFPSKTPTITTVRVVLGENANLDASLSGNVPGVALWNRFGQQIGYTKGSGDVKAQGSFMDIEVEHDEKIGNIPAEYMSISAGGNDAICISWITLTFPDGQTTNFLPGEMGGALCNHTFFESSRELVVGGATPKCLWIDKNHSNGLKYQGFGVHLRDFTESEERGRSYVQNPDLACRSGPRFRMYEKLDANDPILFFDPEPEYDQNGVDVDPSKIINNPGTLTPTKRRRDAITPSPEEVGATKWANSTVAEDVQGSTSLFDGRLVVSNMATHSARILCEHPNSFGPDFVSIREQLYCDMSQRSLYDLCSTSKTSCCFDLEQNTLKGCEGNVRGMTKARLLSSNSTKSYGNVQYWGMG